MYCAKCGNTLPDGSVICGYCGELVGLEEESANPLGQSIEGVPLSEEIYSRDQSQEGREAPAYEYQTMNQEMVDINEQQSTSFVPESIEKPSEAEKVPLEQSPVWQEIQQEAGVPKHFARRSAGMDKRARPIGTAGFFGTQLLLIIPVINIILLFVWAFRRRANFNRKAYARSILIWILIFLLLLLAGLITMIVLKMPMDINYWIDQLKAAVNSIPRL